ncbi:MAG: hypothetical protein CMI79_01770 [Candidatus Pelagibacter sp.]|nr:hypothetical protein [Candidatus Pelagibacter sp.]|tara:strand:+ start:5467 stop:6447 length:981 start_codon:yes stop_codon:yes gene_type:complete
MKQIETKADKKGTKKDEFFLCKLCDYSTCHCGHWKRHIETKKHKKLEMKQNETNETKTDENRTKRTRKTKLQEYCCEKCEQPFGSRTSLWRHKKKCAGVLVTTVTNNTFESSVVTAAMQENQVLREQLKEQNDRMYEIAKASTNALMNQNTYVDMNNCTNNYTSNQNNNNFNINLFLNEKCSDALSIQDFAKKLQLTMADLLQTKENKAIGLANIVVKNLEPLSLTERPLHCTESDEWFVKDKSSGWEKDSGKTAQLTEHGILQHWPDVFQSEHPDWVNDEKMTNKYVEIAGVAASKLSDAERKKLCKAMKANCTLTEKDVLKVIK